MAYSDLKKIYEDHSDEFVKRIAGSHGIDDIMEAEDIVHNAFLRVITRIKELNLKMDDPYNYLSKVVSNERRRYLNSKRKNFFCDEFEDECTIEKELYGDNSFDILELVSEEIRLSKLEDHNKLIVYMYFIEMLPLSYISEESGLTVEHIKMKCSKFKDKLKKKYEGLKYEILDIPLSK